MNKIPRVFKKKWKRYTKFEKIFLMYLLVLFFIELFLPIMLIEGESYSFINRTFLTTSIVLFLTLFFLLLWNLSYRLKSFIKSIFGFNQNDAILNFGVFFIHSVVLIHTQDFLSLLSYKLSSNLYSIKYWFYILAIFLVIGMIWSLFLAINLSLNFLNKKKSSYAKVIANPVVEEEKETKEIKTLF